MMVALNEIMGSEASQTTFNDREARYEFPTILERQLQLCKAAMPGHQWDQDYLPDLPLYPLEAISNRREDASYIALDQLLCTDWLDAGNNVQSLRVAVSVRVWARDNSARMSLEPDGAGPRAVGFFQSETGGRLGKPFKEQFLKIMKNKHHIVQLRIIVEAKLQSKIVPEGDNHRADFWQTDPWFLRQWLPGLGLSPQNLSIVDYEQQAILRRSSIISASMSFRFPVAWPLPRPKDSMDFQGMEDFYLRFSKLAKGVEKLEKLEKLQLRMQASIEENICSRINHPSIVKYFTYFTVTGPFTLCSRFARIIQIIENREKVRLKKERRKTVLEEGRMKARLEEEVRKALEEEQRKASEEERKKAQLEEERKRARLEEERWKAVLMSAVALLLLVYQYLTGYIDRRGTKIHSSGSLEFRPTFISIVLFLGAYIWIKFRNVASFKGYRRPIKDKSSGTTKPAARLEVRYKPPRSSGIHNHIHLCMCDTDEEAEIYKKIAGRYYNEQKNDGQLDLGAGKYFFIPSMPIELEEGFSVSEKRTWMKDKVMKVYKDFLQAKDARRQQDVPNNTIIHLNDGPGADHDAPLLGGSSIAFNYGFGAEEVEMMYLPPVPQDDAELVGYPEVDLLNVPTEGFEFSDILLQQPAFESQDIPNIDQEISVFSTTTNQMDEGKLMVSEGALPNSKSPINCPFLPHQQGSDAVATHPNMVAPFVPNFGPTNSTTGLLVIPDEQIQEQDEKQSKLIHFLKQQNQEQQKLISFLQQQIQEQQEFILQQFTA